MLPPQLKQGILIEFRPLSDRIRKKCISLITPPKSPNTNLKLYNKPSLLPSPWDAPWVLKAWLPRELPAPKISPCSATGDLWSFWLCAFLLSSVFPLQWVWASSYICQRSKQILQVGFLCLEIAPNHTQKNILPKNKTLILSFVIQW